MGDDEEERSEEVLRQRLVQFLETASLYAPEEVPDISPRRHPARAASSIPFPTDLRIQLSCAQCGGSARTFQYEFQSANERQLDTLALAVDESAMLRFVCTHCRKQRTAFLIHITQGYGQRLISVIKVGQWPSDRPRPHQELARALGDEAASLYQKGLTVERFGFGIGAFAYYRRVTEVIIDRLMTNLNRFAEDTGATDLVTAIASVANETQASKRIEAVKELVPRALRPAGQLNPLGTIYAALSDDLHSGSDAKCQEGAANLRVALEFVLLTLASHVTRGEDYAEALRALQQGRGKKPDPTSKV